ncbi:MAG: DUF4325 domain-containing protein [Balneolales bacterium]
MITFTKHINIQKVLLVSVLSTRATARTLFHDVIRNYKNRNKFKLDFKHIEFASRSFIDELNSLIVNHPHISFKKVNMNKQVKQMDELVHNKNDYAWEYNNKHESDLVVI